MVPVVDRSAMTTVYCPVMLRLALLASLALACGSTVYRCDTSAQCTRSGAPGMCLHVGAVGYCASSDPSCTGGQRWDDTAGDGLSGTCVMGDAGAPEDLAATADAAHTVDASVEPPRDGARDAAPDLTPPADLVVPPQPDLQAPPGFVAQHCAGADAIVGLWGSSASDIYAVSNQGQICHSSGNDQWSVLASTGKSLYGIWGSGPSDVWVVGAQGAILHYTGTGAGFVAVSSPTTDQITSVFGCSATDVWAVAEGATHDVLHYTPSGAGVWTTTTSTSPVGGVWCDATSRDVWVVGRGTIKHGTGGTFSALTPPSATTRLFTVTGSSKTEVYMGGDGGALWLSSPTGISTVPAPSNISFTGLWSLAPMDLYAATSDGIYHLQAGTLTKLVAPPGPFYCVWGSGAGDVYVGGTAGLIAHGK